MSTEQPPPPTLPCRGEEVLVPYEHCYLLPKPSCSAATTRPMGRMGSPSPRETGFPLEKKHS